MGVVHPIDITPEQHETVLTLLQRYLPGIKTWVYGSRAKWTSRPDSDLDLVVFTNPKQRLRIGELREAFEESNLPFRVDLFVWEEISDSFRENILEEHVELVSGRVEAPDSITPDWPLVAVEEFSDKVAMGPFGSSIKVETFVPDGIPVISGQHLHDSRVNDTPGYNFIEEDHAKRLSNANVQRGDIVLTHRGNIGQVSYIPEDSQYKRYIISQSQFCMRCDPTKAIPEFVTYYFRSPEGQYKLLANASQVGVPSIAQPVTYLRTIEVPLPPLPEQRAIAHILGTLDDKIELNQRMNETLEAMARAIFKDWFVDFGPVRAKVEGREPYLSPDIWNLFPDIFDDKGLPESWSYTPLAALSDLNPESWSKNNFPDGIEYVDLANTKWGTIETTQSFTWRYAPSRAKRILRPGDTIVGLVRPGNGSYSFISDSGLTGSTGFAVLRPLEPRYTELIFLSVTDSKNIKRLVNLADGAAYPAVRPEVVGETEIPIPDDAVLNRFAGCVSPVLDRMETNKKENRTLAWIRDLLLPRLMSGEIHLCDAGKIVETAVS